MKNEYYDTFNLKSDESVLNMYKDRNRYVPDAQEAIIEILKKRDLYQQIVEQEIREEAENERLEKNTIQAFERKVFGNNYHVSNIEFAQNSLYGNQYFKANFSVIQNKFVFGNIAIVIGLLGAISLFMFLITNEYKKDLILYWGIPSFVLSLFLIIGFKGRKSSKSTVTLLRKSDKQIDLSIQMGEDQITVNYPFRYEYFWTYAHSNPYVKQVNLFIFIFKHNEIMVSLNETLDARKQPPPHWSYFPTAEIIKESKFSFTNYGFESPNLYKLQKILDGIKEQY